MPFVIILGLIVYNYSLRLHKKMTPLNEHFCIKG